MDGAGLEAESHECLRACVGSGRDALLRVHGMSSDRRAVAALRAIPLPGRAAAHPYRVSSDFVVKNRNQPSLDFRVSDPQAVAGRIPGWRV